MTFSTAIYARSSPDCPISAEQQVEHLRMIATERGWVVTGVFTDHPITVKRGRERRPGETALRDAIRHGVSLWLNDQKLDTARSNGLSIFDTADLMAHHVRQSRRARILQGQASARNLQVRFGRPPIPVPKLEKAKTFLATGKSLREVARLAGISPSAVGRLKNAMGSAAV
jgi:DNA invertase Pin-like site-specific DNA recombinase